MVGVVSRKGDKDGVVGVVSGDGNRIAWLESYLEMVRRRWW